MSVADFFANCKLNITFDDDTDIDDFQYIFDHFHYENEPTAYASFRSMSLYSFTNIVRQDGLTRRTGQTD